ncbi:Free methionine-R-sulfoxide reductase [Apiospora rasikravindrae]|uniref:Free methionine-R-sulfoxide reductase n=1 Tax=Apiospora rasikravindrae TaxID=990691 RepID=A0ABR1RSH3_9PEZI
MAVQISQEWYDEKMQDGAASPEQCTTLKAYFDQTMPVEDAIRILTKPVHQAAVAAQDRTDDEVDELCNLWAIIIDLIIEWQAAHPQVLQLLHAITRLPTVDRTGKASLGTFTDDAGAMREYQLWEDLPKFWNLLSDYWSCTQCYFCFLKAFHLSLFLLRCCILLTSQLTRLLAYVAWRNRAVQSQKNTVTGDNEWTRINAFAALALVDEGPFQGMTLLSNWGRQALDLAAQGGAATAHVDVPVAASWLVLAGPELRKIHTQQEAQWQQAFEDISKAERLDQPLRDDAADMMARLSGV